MFKLRRYFSVTSLIGVLIVVAGLLFFYRYLAFHALKQHETQANVALTRVFANVLWPTYAPFLTRTEAIPQSELRGRPEIKQLRADILRLMKDLRVVKVKIYNLDGLTVFSTDPGQIGDDASGNTGFLSAKAGRAISDIAFRHSFDAFEETIVDRDLISTYIPIRAGDSSAIEGVFEVYSDVSALVAELKRTQWQIAAAVLGSLALLYFFLHLIVRRADKIIRLQSEEERVANREKLRHQAFHDSLTGLPNRAQFAERLDEAIAQAQKTRRAFAVLFVDLDNFKYVNDSLGHHIGDLLLQEVGKQFTSCLRETDVVARIGGDEFIILLPEIGKTGYAGTVAEKICSASSNQTYNIEGRQLRITPSIGISVYPYDGKTAGELIKNADAAMYHAKEMGRNNHQFYTADMNAKAFAVLSMERSLLQAIERQEFLLYYQPQVDLGTGRIIGAEALIRWQHPEMGLAHPTQFIPFAEERGLIVPIGDWALHEACRRNRVWQQSGVARVPVAVNVSALQFRQRDFIEKIAQVLRQTGLAPEYLEIEITESVIMHGAETTTSKVRELKALGVKISIDDFGTGYSSLSYLKRFPIDRLKLDQSFVRGLPTDPDDLAIATAVLDMAQALKLKVIAEGVETKEQLEFLRSRKCAEVQGHYFSRPLTADEFVEFVAGFDAHGVIAAG